MAGGDELRIMESQKRLSHARQRVLEALREGPRTNVELNKLCFRYGARIYELRHRFGHVITKDRNGPGLYTYTLCK
jgi:hypothetical protein